MGEAVEGPGSVNGCSSSGGVESLDGVKRMGMEEREGGISVRCIDDLKVD